MCTLVEDYAKKYAKEQAKEFAMYLISIGRDTAEITEVTHLSEEEIENLRD